MIFHAWAARVDLNWLQFLDLLLLLLPFLRFPQPALISGGMWCWQTYLRVYKRTIMFLFFLDVLAALKLNDAGLLKIIFLNLLECCCPCLHHLGYFLDNDFKGR